MRWRGPPGLRPRFVAADLAALCGRTSDTEIVAQPGWLVEIDGGGVLATLHSRGVAAGGASAGGTSGTGDVERLAALRALCAACWSAGVVPAAFTGGDARASAALAALRLPAP